ATASAFTISPFEKQTCRRHRGIMEIVTSSPFLRPCLTGYDALVVGMNVDNESTFKERFFVDKADPNLLHDVILVFDHALTRPWTVDKTFRRNPDPRPEWPEEYCHVTTKWLVLGGQAYRLNDEGILLPTRKDQPP